MEREAGLQPQPYHPNAGTPPQPAPRALPVPANLIEFTRMYGDEDACLEALIKARWPQGFACPRCAHTTGWPHANRRLIECASCGHQASPTAGTLFHMAKLELHKLFLMLYLIVAEKDGANAKQLQRQAGVNYKTARLWLLKIRELLRARDSKQASEKFPKVHRVAALLKRVTLGTLQGSQSRGWLPWLLAEFEFRFNRRTSRTRPLLWSRLMEMGLNGRGKTRRYFSEKGAMFHEMGLT